ncbi:MAG: UDP-N-acetylmuramoyl-L-alanyl-D-glutamate--2,6-diaminopimelate ligase [Clostridia bacterium]|nr:UDP-N-acetylmuramoyl-L-alanyl-D-glutamate--2,6-diaminopimelate ligase [Clostridia bacterium]
MLASVLLNKEWNCGNDVEISGIAYDSRQVMPGYAFVCIKGFETDGHKFARSAIERGAALIVAEDETEASVPVCYVSDTRKTLADMACAFYGNPSKNFKLVGVTGTNGKTTVTYLIKSILDQAGCRVGIIGTNQNIIGDKVLLTKSTTPTTPNSLELQKIFSEMTESGAEYVVMEVSSHALDLSRVRGCSFDVGVFTNLTRDHLDFHKTMKNYMLAKAKLFDQSAFGAVNLDDEYGRKIYELHEGDAILTYGIDSECDVRAKDIKITPRGVNFTVTYKETDYPMFLCIPGMFSVYNAMSAICACISLGIDMDTITKGLRAAVGVLGRVEVVPTDTDYTVIIDYAHTPDGLENIIRAMKSFAKGRVITLFGCGGDRDNSKRAPMGEISGSLSDFTIITSDNPRTEDPMAIINMIEEGIKTTDGEYTVIPDRRRAIAYALDNAAADDVIILAGKGQETYQIIGKEKFDFDERVVVFSHLNKESDK